MKEEKTSEILSQEQKENINKAKELIVCSFDWSQTSSGGDYWLEVFKKLENLVYPARHECNCEFCERKK